MIGDYVQVSHHRNPNNIFASGIVIQEKYIFVPQDDEINRYGFSHFVMHDIIFCSKDGNAKYYTYVHEPTCYEILGSVVKQECCNHTNYKIIFPAKDST